MFPPNGFKGISIFRLKKHRVKSELMGVQLMMLLFILRSISHRTNTIVYGWITRATQAFLTGLLHTPRKSLINWRCYLNLTTIATFIQLYHITLLVRLVIG